MDIIATFLLVLVGLPPSGEFQAVIMIEFDSYSECLAAIEGFDRRYGLPLGQEPLNHDLVCLEDIREVRPQHG